ncbi:MAG TPA: STAS domain-containing protein [Thermoleophilaceae bacterium]
MTIPAELSVERAGGVMIARLGGEVDMTNSTYVRDELVAAMPNDALALVIDLSACRYLDSAAIEVLFDLARRLGRRRQRLHVVLSPSSPLRRVLILTDVAAVAELHDSLEEAVAAVG